MHVGRPSAGAPPATPARFAASFGSIALEGLPANNTTSGATGESPSGAYSPQTRVSSGDFHTPSKKHAFSQAFWRFSLAFQ